MCPRHNAPPVPADGRGAFQFGRISTKSIGRSNRIRLAQRGQSRAASARASMTRLPGTCTSRQDHPLDAESVALNITRIISGLEVQPGSTIARGLSIVDGQSDNFVTPLAWPNSLDIATYSNPISAPRQYTRTRGISFPGQCSTESPPGPAAPIRLNSAARKQRTSWPGAMVCSGGESSRQRSTA